MGEVIDLHVITTIPTDPARVLSAASDVEFDRVLIIGRTKDGAEYFASSDPDGGTLLWDMERCKHALMQLSDIPSDREGK